MLINAFLDTIVIIEAKWSYFCRRLRNIVQTSVLFSLLSLQFLHCIKQRSRIGSGIILKVNFSNLGPYGSSGPCTSFPPGDQERARANVGRQTYHWF